MENGQMEDLEAEGLPDDAGAGAGDLASALAPGDEGFVVEEKKSVNTGTLVMLGLIVAGVAGTYLMMMRAGPKSASAGSPDAAAANKTITQFLQDGQENRKMMENMLKSTEKVVEQFTNYPSMAQVPLSDLKTNPFRHAIEAPAGQAPSLSEAAEKKRREEERVAMLKAVQELQLQSVLHGDARRACMINNTLYQEGQAVEGFAIEKISPNAVIVKQGSYRFELRMQK
ncbi:MAG: general secretion pathway protein GspB [Tepidisphaeraceae bacterium]